MKRKPSKQNYIKPFLRIIIVFILIILFAFFFFIVFLVSKYVLVKINELSEEDINKLSFWISAIVEAIIGCALASISKVRKLSIMLYNKAEIKVYKYISLSKMNIWRKSHYISNYNNDRINLIPSQSKAIQIFFNSLNNDDRNIFYIKGDYNTGKTSTIAVLFDQCTESTKLFKKLNRKSIYICPYYSDSYFLKMIDCYNHGQYKKYYIFIDDIGELSNLSQIRIWRSLLLPFFRNNECNAKSIVLISNKNRSVINSKISLEDKNKYVLLPIERNHNNSIDSYNLFSKCDFFPQNNKAVMIWLNRISYFEDSEKVISLLLESRNNSIKSLFVGLTILCLFSRVTNINSLKTLYLSRGYTRIKFHNNLRTLVNNRLVLFFPFIKNTLYLDSDIAKLFAKRYRKEQIYGEMLSNFVEGYFVSGSIERWLLNCECRMLGLSKTTLKENNRLFKEAFNTGCYTFLLKELVEIISSNKAKEYMFYKELGYLYEKTGNRQDAIDYINRFLKSSQDEEERQKIYLLLFEIIHHVNQNTKKLEYIKESDNLYIKLQSEYWLKHIEIEKGIFNFYELKRITNSYLQIKQYQNELNYYHILRRMFSDLARVYFLQGKIDKIVFTEFKLSMKESGLSDYHSEYEDFFNLLTKAHYLHYDVIFQLGFYGRFIYDCDDEYGENPKIEEMLSIAISEYEKCESNFKSYGDKAWHTISIRKNELKVCSSIQPVKIIDELESEKSFFINNSNELHLAFVNCIICKIKFLNLFFNPFEIEWITTISECYDLLDKAKELYTKFENAYGLYRICFIKAFLDLYSGIQNDDDKEATIKTFRETISNLQEERYNREYEMINSILKYKNIKMELIARFFKYYPIVLQ